MAGAEKVKAGSRRSEEGSLFAQEAARLMTDRHCTDVQLLDLRGISQVCDFIVIGSGTSDRQMRSVSEEVGKLGKETGYTWCRMNSDPSSTWIVVDFIDVVIDQEGRPWIALAHNPGGEEGIAGTLVIGPRLRGPLPPLSPGGPETLGL